MKGLTIIKTMSYALVVASMLCSCDVLGSADKHEIIFKADGYSTKANYSNTNSFQLIWEDGDKIDLFSSFDDEHSDPQLESAAYSVTAINTSQPWECSLSAESTSLKWYDRTTSHDFYASYPKAKGTYNNHRVTFPIPYTQNNASDYMKNAFMVASASGLTYETAPDHVVSLAFKPIMTTLVITLVGKADDATDAGRRIVNSVAFKTRMPDNGDGTFSYLPASNTAYAAPSEKTVTWAPTSALTLNGAADEEHAETATFTVFLPFTEISNSNPLQVKVFCKDKDDKDKTYFVTVDNVTITAGSKIYLKASPFSDLPTASESGLAFSTAMMGIVDDPNDEDLSNNTTYPWERL